MIATPVMLSLLLVLQVLSQGAVGGLAFSTSESPAGPADERFRRSRKLEQRERREWVLLTIHATS